MHCDALEGISEISDIGRDGIIELGVIQTLDVQISRGERVSGAIVIAEPVQG